MRNTEQFWSLYKNTNKYTFDVSNTNISESISYLLKNIGLPVINTGYHNFFPIHEIKVIKIRDKEYIVMGTPFDNHQQFMDDNIFVLNPISGEVFFYTKSLSQINMFPEFSKENNSLHSFLYYQMEFYNIVQKVFIINNQLKFQQVESNIKDLLQKLSKHDNFKLNTKADTSFFWKKHLYSIIADIEEKYDAFIVM